ncbi:hypothetical protein HY404_03545 [Candidatus Microgenomates bacterium]|nr:hypothetical protein [Candidatus Microgenomates bacterium]
MTERNSSRDPTFFETRRRLNKLLLVAPFILPELLIACAPESKVATQPKELPANIRAMLPESIARATEEAMQPKKEVKGASAQDIKITKPVFTNCNEENVWGGWVVELGNKNYFLKKGQFSIEKQTPSGSVISKKELLDVKLAAGSTYFIPAITKSGAITHNGEGSKLGRVNLTLDGSLDWSQVDGSDKEYSFITNFGGFGKFKPQEFMYMNGYNIVYYYPATYFKVNVKNQGERGINKLSIFGILLSSKGELLDIFVSPGLVRSGGKGVGIPYGKEEAVMAVSLSESGQCVNTKYGGPTELLYWVYFETHTGMPVVKHETI